MICFNQISKRFDQKQVLHNLSLQIHENETVAIMGTSGCGKTTLARILLGLETPDQGTITGMKGKRLSAVFQEDTLCESFDGMTNILIGCKKVEYMDLSEDLHSVGLTMKDVKKPVRELSGGMKRRVAILRAIKKSFDVIVLDEPFKGLDEVTKQKTMAYVKENIKGKTAILITHDESEAEFFTDCIIRLS